MRERQSSDEPTEPRADLPPGAVALLNRLNAFAREIFARHPGLEEEGLRRLAERERAERAERGEA